MTRTGIQFNWVRVAGFRDAFVDSKRTASINRNTYARTMPRIDRDRVHGKVWAK